MNSLIRLALVSILGFHAVALRGRAQDGPKVRISGAGSDRPPTKLFQAAEARLATEPFDQRAESLLQSADAFTRALFHLSGAKLDRFATYRSPDGDCLVASWSFGEPANTALVNDTPYQSIYSFRIRGARHLAADGLVSFLRELIIFDEPPLKLNAGELSIDVDPVSSTVLYFTGRTSSRSPYSLARDLQVSASTDERDWYISVIVPKVYAKSYYPEPLLIPERFPPLSELLKSWSFDHIWSEVGVHGVSLVADLWADRRDQQLIAELFRRGLSQPQFVDLLVSKDVIDLRDRLREVWWGASEAHAEVLYAGYGAAALRSYAQIGPRAEESAQAYFIGDCSPEFDSLAKATLKEQVYWTGPIRYISRCSNSTDDLRMLETLAVPDRASESWKFAVGQMRGRLQSVSH
jgi:hypothetical protein